MRKFKNSFMVFMVICCALAMVACASTGNQKVNKSRVDEIVEGKTVKDEVKASLGHPDGGIMFLEKKQLEDFLYQITLERPPEDMYPPDKYEIWQYRSWNYTAIPIPFVSLIARGVSSEKTCLLIFNSKGVCHKKFFTEGTKVK